MKMNFSIIFAKKYFNIISTLVFNPFVLVNNSSSFAQKLQAKKSTLVFFDDFSGPILDRSKWNVTTTHNVINNEQQAYIDTSATIYIVHGAEAEGALNGALVLKASFRPDYTNSGGHKFDFISGRIESKEKRNLPTALFRRV